MIRGLLACGLLVAATAHADPAAWRVAKNGHGELFLLGSVHYLRSSDYPLPAIVDELYRRADGLVMELDLENLDPQKVQTAFLSAALLPPGTSLRDVVAPSLYRRAERSASTLGIDLHSFDRFEPWFAAISILDVGMARQGYRADKGLEQYLLAKAERDAKTITGLESLNSQIALFDKLPQKQQQLLLEQTVDELASSRAEMGRLIDAWRNGRLRAMTGALMQDFDGFPGLYDALVRERNAAWVPTLEHLIDGRRRYLVVVGALHLVGKGSVVDLLRADGYEVSRVR